METAYFGTVLSHYLDLMKKRMARMWHVAMAAAATVEAAAARATAARATAEAAAAEEEEE